MNDINNKFIISTIYSKLPEIKKSIVDGADIHVNNDYALKFISGGYDLDIIKFLNENGANIDRVDEYRLSMMLGSHKHYNPVDLDIVKFLVEKGADIHADDDYALKASSGLGRLDIVKILFENGANIHADDDYALKTSSEKGYLNIVKFLIENGADIHAGNDDALRLSSKNRHFKIIYYLVKKGANVTVINKDTLEIIRVHYPKLFELIKQERKKGVLTTFKNVAKKIVSVNKDKHIYYKWQKLCSSLGEKDSNEIKNLAFIHGISTNNKSKREICKLLSDEYEKQIRQTPKCQNETTILGDPISLIPKPLLFAVKEGKYNYCFNIIELIESINSGDTKNPWTRTQLPIVKIQKKMAQLRQILLSDKLSLVNILDEIKNNQIMTKENILRLKVVNLIALLNYTPNIDNIVSMSKTVINKMFKFLNENELMHVYGKKTIENLIEESLRLLQIDDKYKDTRKAAYEIYLNEVFTPKARKSRKTKI